MKHIYGKRKLRQIDSRLQWLNRRLENIQVVDGPLDALTPEGEARLVRRTTPASPSPPPEPARVKLPSPALRQRPYQRFEWRDLQEAWPAWRSPGALRPRA